LNTPQADDWCAVEIGKVAEIFAHAATRGEASLELPQSPLQIAHQRFPADLDSSAACSSPASFAIGGLELRQLIQPTSVCVEKPIDRAASSMFR
jgi:hypothetical protein